MLRVQSGIVLICSKVFSLGDIFLRVQPKIELSLFLFLPNQRLCNRIQGRLIGVASNCYPNYPQM